MRPTEENEELYAYCRHLLTGNIRDPWIDRQVEHLFPRQRVIKEIRANLFLKWMNTKFPDIPLLFIIRHPCAVVLSRMELDWATDSDIEPFLSQEKLIDDHLSDKMEIIKGAKTAEEKHAIIWSISNLIPLRQFHSDGLHIIFYEDLCVQTEKEIPKIFEAIGMTYDDSVFNHILKPSTTTIGTSAIVTGRDKVTRWKEKLSSDQIDSIYSVVERFGLENLYGDSCLPKHDVVQ
jgi:hypothetical protein